MASKGNKIDKFTEMFDRDWKRTRSSLRTRTADSRSYDASYSWDARSDNPAAFSRLNATEMPVQHTRPITLSGSAVIQLDHTPGPFLSVYPATQRCNIPLTCEQVDVNMSTDLKGKVPIVEEARATNKAVVIDERPGFRLMGMHPPTFRTESVPSYITEAGPQADQRLLTPAQRRGIQEFEKRQQEAYDYMRVATADRARTRKQIAGHQFQRGILMVESSHNEDSEIYGEKAKKVHAERDYKSLIHLERRSNLATHMSSIATNGNILVPESVAPRVKTEPFYQSKGGTNHAFSFEETHNRLFCRQERAPGGGADTKNPRCRTQRKAIQYSHPYDYRALAIATLRALAEQNSFTSFADIHGGTKKPSRFTPSLLNESLIR